MANEFLKFFGFTEDPFKITPDIDFFFNSKSHQEALAALEYLYEAEEGFVVIVGEPGTGKTITIRKFLSTLPENVEYAYILFPNLSPQELLLAILEDFKVEVPENINKNALFSHFRDFLIKKKQEGKKLFIIVDEAQNLPVETLEELRILSNLETDKEKLLQIVLVGQPELEEKLNSPKLRQLKQRITLFIRLKHLDEEETKNYINYRLSKAGNSTVKITNRALKEVYRISQGIPRIINQIMERALISAFLEQETTVDLKHIKRAEESLNITKKDKVKAMLISDTAKTALTFLLGGIFFITLYLLFFTDTFNKCFADKSKTEVAFKEIDEKPQPPSKEKEKTNTKPKKEEKVSKPEETPTTKTTKSVGKKYIMYFATTPSYEEAKKLKEKYENLTNKKFYILKVQNGKYYAVARLYDDKELGKKELKQLKTILNDKDAFLTGKMYKPEVVE